MQFELDDTPYVKMLEEALDICKKGGIPSMAKKVTGLDKVSQRYTRKLHLLLQSLSKVTSHEKFISLIFWKQYVAFIHVAFQGMKYSQIEKWSVTYINFFLSLRR